MALSFEVRKARASTGSKRASFDIVECRVHDPDYSGIDVTYRFSIHTPDKAERTVTLDSVKIGQAWTRPGRPVTKRFTLSGVRDLPLARWEQAARGVVTWAIDDLEEWGDPRIAESYGISSDQVFLEVTPGHSSPPRQHDVDELVKTIDPNLEDDDTPGGRRRRTSLRKLANVAIDYRAALMNGRSDPAAAISEKYGVSPSTARSWIHRARAAGLLSPAVGRTAGEGVKLFTQGSYRNSTSVEPVGEVESLTALAAHLDAKMADLTAERAQVHDQLRHYQALRARAKRDEKEQIQALAEHINGTSGQPPAENVVYNYLQLAAEEHEQFRTKDDEPATSSSNAPTSAE